MLKQVTVLFPIPPMIYYGVGRSHFLFLCFTSSICSMGIMVLAYWREVIRMNLAKLVTSNFTTKICKVLCVPKMKDPRDTSEHYSWPGVVIVSFPCWGPWESCSLSLCFPQLSSLHVQIGTCQYQWLPNWQGSRRSMENELGTMISFILPLLSSACVAAVDRAEVRRH